MTVRAAGSAGPTLEPTRTAPEDRGRTEISKRALERITAHLVGEMDDVGGAARRVLGVRMGEDSAEATPQVDAQIDGRLATLHLTLSVVYPAPVRQVAGRVREHVADRAGELTGLEVRQVDVDITRLVRPAAGRRVR